MAARGVDRVKVAECKYCEQTVRLAADGAWETVDGGSCGCSASEWLGGDGEHEADEMTIEEVGSDGQDDDARAA